jgi:DNA-binding MarR family transcriptional regulator
MINGLINDLGRGLNDSTIRSRLLSLREQAEAVDLDLQRARAELKRLKKDAKPQEIVSKQDSLEEVAVKLLELLANPLPANTISPYTGTPSLEQMARRLGIKQVVAQYHADTLVEKGLIGGPSAITRQGTMYFLTEKGTKYVVENKLA